MSSELWRRLYPPRDECFEPVSYKHNEEHAETNNKIIAVPLYFYLRSECEHEVEEL